MNRRTAWALVAVTLLGTGCASGQQAGRDGPATTITEEDIARRVGVMAHDSMGGRVTPSDGLERTVAWLAAELGAMGLEGGAAGGGFVQRYLLVRTAVDTAA